MKVEAWRWWLSHRPRGWTHSVRLSHDVTDSLHHCVAAASLKDTREILSSSRTWNHYRGAHSPPSFAIR